ncbi:Mbeg1-like protein [Caviibacter abscessus]|uniref:Mbeg1-like protein n=1 Tax=Caviibacter abscessus TaxID=1766719 RepID=UPI00082C9248|nr:Mbeg1-like protein [Caviibacter abscessus]
MATIFDYIKENNEEITEKNFNILDSLIMTRIVYLPFDKILFKNEKKTLHYLLNIVSKYKDKYFLMKDDIKLVKYLLESKRFKNIEVFNYINIIDKEIEKQFGAMVLDLGFANYVSFKGTDKTLIGWKEDLNMSYDKVPSQEESIIYLKDVLDITDKNVFIGGHSKGGNLAIYSSIYVDNASRINRIYNFDGPGFLNDVLNEKGYEKIVDKIETIIPSSSIIGLLLNRKEKIKIINSTSFFVMQHDLYSWGISKNDFVYLDKITNISSSLDKSISMWLEQTTPKERKEFINSVYSKIIKEKSVKNLKEINTEVITKLLNNILKNIKL